MRFACKALFAAIALTAFLCVPFAHAAELPAVPSAALPVPPAPAAAAVPAAPVAPAPAPAYGPIVAGDPALAAKIPDVSNMVFIQNLRKIGATIYYLGENLGLNGWFVVKDKQVQILYTSADNRALLIGALLTADGANVSQQQMMQLAGVNPTVADIIKSAGTASAAAPAAENALPGPQLDNGVPPSEQFYNALLKSAHVTFGKEQAPQLVMIMDVHCEFCRRTWKKLEPLVDAGNLNLVMVPVAALGKESQVEAGNWLGKKDPLDAWKRHVGGDEKVLKDGPADPAQEQGVWNNTMLIKKWGIDQTPTLLYRGKNGKIRLVSGEPPDIKLITEDQWPVAKDQIPEGKGNR